MTQGIAVASRGPRARMTGAVYLLYFVTAIPAELLASRKLVVYGNALNVIAFALYVVVTVLFYFMFKPVNRSLSLAAAFSSLAGCVIGLLGLFHRAPYHLNPLLFFAPYCLLIGCLILRSTFLPRLLGWLMVLAGLGWLAFLSRAVARHVAAPIEVLGIVAEASLMLWLLIKGVNEERWKQQAAAE